MNATFYWFPKSGKQQYSGSSFRKEEKLRNQSHDPPKKQTKKTPLCEEVTLAGFL